jgi:hypothetical protein
MAKGFFSNGTGTLADPFLIEDAYDLYAIRFGLSKHYKLVDNINLDVPPFDITGWTPIPGTFTGSLNGNEKKIFNLVINADTKDDVGLFSYVNSNYYDAGGWIRNFFNLSIENAKVNGRNNVGILAGRMYVRPIDGNTDDPSTHSLEKIHVSGNVNGLNNVGGMIGFLDCYNTSYTYQFAEDLYSDVQLYLQTELSQAGLLFGYINSSWTVYCPMRITDCVVKGSVISPSVSQKAYSIACLGVNTSLLTLNGCIYDSTIWNGKQTPGSIAKTTTKMMLKEEFSNLELKKTATGASTWLFGYQRYPRLWFMELNNLFIAVDGKYYIYDDVNKQWVKKYDRLPTKAEAVRDGMKTLDDVGRAAWDAMETMSSSVELVNIVDKSVGITLKDYLVTLDRDAAKDMPGKQIYRKEIVLADYDHGIFNIETK